VTAAPDEIANAPQATRTERAARQSVPENGKNPLVSVLLASRDGARYLPQALESLQAQTYPALEILAVDDGSEDETGEILRRFAASDPRLVTIRTAGIGLAGALAEAARQARGTYLARQDDDDRSRPERIERQVAYLESHPEVGALGTAATVIDASGNVLGDYPVPLSTRAVRKTLRRATPFVHGSVVMRRSAYERAGGYRPAFRASQDYDLWLRWPPGEELANLADPLYEWRLHPSGVFSRARGDQLFYSAIARAFAEEREAGRPDSIGLLHECPGLTELLARYPRAGRLAFYLGEIHVREGLGREARHYLGRALRDPESRLEAIPWWILAWLIPFTPRGRRAAHRRSKAR
jgi:glycosyltransferase involved in cell wall biosynthesis